jgi:carboxyl-terminal processing protease
MPRRNLTILLLVAVASWLCYQRAARNRYAQALTEAMNIVSTNYIAEVEPRVLFEGAMDGMIGKLDPYSGYTSPDELNQFQQQIEGEFVGIGIVVDHDAENSRLSVAEALIGKPAYMAGIRAGDSIIAIDDKETKDLSLREAISLIRGKRGTSVKLRILHAGRDTPVNYSLERATIPLETVLGDARAADGKWVYRLVNHPRIGYIRIFDNFGERTADEFRAALASYRQPGQQIDGLILDLRYNRGGLLEAARDICDMLLDGGIIVTTRGRENKLLKQYVAEPGVELPQEVPIVVLVDRLSASASEIVAAALQDNHRAAVAGQRSWGKATVQNVIMLEGRKSAIRLTVGSYHRPSGQEIHKWKDAKDSDPWGVKPDPGLESLLTNQQNEQVILARRKRDFLRWDDLAKPVAGTKPGPGAPPTDSPPLSAANPPVPQADDEGQTAEKTPSPDAQAVAAAKQDPATIDPQLQKAIEHLQKEISGQNNPQPLL